MEGGNNRNVVVVVVEGKQKKCGGGGGGRKQWKCGGGGGGGVGGKQWECGDGGGGGGKKTIEMWWKRETIKKVVVEEYNRNVVVEKKLRVWSVWGSCMVDVGSMYGRCGRRWKLKIKSKIKKGK